MAKLALLQAWVCGSACAACKCANVRLAKIELKKMCGGENKKYRSVGNECRLTRCPFIISFLCRWSPVKMVYFFLVYVRLCLLCRVVLRLLVTDGTIYSCRLRAVFLSSRTAAVAGYKACCQHGNGN